MEREEPAQALWRLWRRGQRPLVRDFIGQAGDLSAAQLLAVLAVDQREHWQAGERRLAESYLREYPRLQADLESALDLVYGEFVLRQG